jgi:hypothetical protein
MVLSASIKMAKEATGNNEVVPLEMRSGIVTVVNKTTTPWTLTVNIGDMLMDGVTFLGWLDPQVGDNVKLLKQGPDVFCLGPMAPGKVYMPPAPPPPPPTPPPAVIAPPPPIVTRQVGINAVGSATGPAENPLGGWRNDRLYQGGGAMAQRAFFFYGNQIADNKAGGIILGGKIFIKRWDASLPAGVNGGANVRLGGHSFATQPGGIPGAHGAVTVVGQLNRDQGVAFDIPQAIIDGMNSGAFKGLGLEPGGMGYTHPDYLLAFPFGPGREWSGSLTLTIRG